MKRQRRERGGFAFDFLQEQHVGPLTVEPPLHVALPLTDRIDVPGRDLHVVSLHGASLWRGRVLPRIWLVVTLGATG